jgi:hypothetical protein
VREALSTINKLNPDFVGRAIQELAINDRYKPIVKSALEKSREILLAV